MRALAFLLAFTLAACADPASPSDAGTAEIPAADSAEAAVGTALRRGAVAPDFALPGAAGETVRLSEQLARGPVVLVFYRGAWCPYCNTQLRDYQLAMDSIRAAGATLLAISPQTPDSSLTIRERQSLTFPVLSDVGNRVSRDYGLVFQVDEATRERYLAVGIDLAASNGVDTWELPVPAVYVIGRDGTIRTSFIEADYTQRASTDAILEALQAL